MRYSGFLFLCCACLSGQPVTPYVRELWLTKTNDAGKVTFHLHNDYSASATAWIVECHGETDPGKEWTSQWHWSDREIGLEGKRLEPGKETSYQKPIRPNPMGRAQSDSADKCENFQVVAVIFADGTVSGDFTWINAILAERQKLYQDIAKANEILTKAIVEGADTEAALKQISEWQQSEGLPARPGRASANYGESSGWRSRPVTEGLQPKSNFMPPRPFARAAAAGVTIGLIQEKKETLQETSKVLADWRARLAEWDAVTGPTVPSSPFPLLRSGGSPRPMMEGPPSEMVGKPAPDFVLRDVNGQEIALKDLRGQTVLLDFWATWCEPCREAMPDIKAAYDEYHDKGLVVVGIDFSESAEIAIKYFEEQKYPFVNLLDPNQQAFQKYGGGGIPKAILIDKDGIVRYVKQGYSSGEDLRPEVKKLVL